MIGLDRIKLMNIKVRIEDWSKLMNSDDVILQYCKRGGFVEEHDGKMIKMIMIRDKTKNGSFVYGHNYKKYANLDICVSHIHENNIGNVSLTEFREYILSMEKHFLDDYGLSVDFKEAKLKYMEINENILLLEPLSQYHREMALIMAHLPTRFKTLGTYGNRASKDKKMDGLNYWLAKNDSREIVLYDKTAQQKKEKKNFQAYVDGKNIIRIELRLLTEDAIDRAFRRCDLFIPDADIETYFQTQIRQLIIDKVKECKKNNLEQLQAEVEIYKKKNKKIWMDGILSYVRNYEMDNRVPLLLHIDDLINILPKDSNYKRTKDRLYGKLVENDVLNRHKDNILDEIIQIFNN